jgi:hypothetical protein
MRFKIKLWVCFIIILVMLPSYTVFAESFNALAEARAITHSDGPFKIRGEAHVIFSETVNGTRQSENMFYRINGYDKNAMETWLQFESRTAASSSFISFLLKPEAIYIKEREWKMADITAVLPQFISMGVLDQFFLLEILNSERLHLYEPYIINGEEKIIGGELCQGLTVEIDRSQFTELAEKLTEDVAALLGDAAKGMSDFQLALFQRFAKGIFVGLEGGGSVTFYINPTHGRIVFIESLIDMANPYGSRAVGANPRIKSQSHWYLYDFGELITSVVP